jgi:predicted dehydrogenase
LVKVGIVGMGFMGMIHYYAAKKVKGAKVVAICTRSRKKLKGDWRSIQGNYGPRGGMEDLYGLRKYEKIGDIVADEGIDMLDICLPTYLHREASIKGLKAGKHVLVEKPITINLRDADAMVAAADRAHRRLMVGQILPFFPEFTYARQALEGGSHGKLIGAHFKRVVSKPTWSADVSDPSKTGGSGIDLHIHDNHFIRLVLGMPRGVYSRGVLSDGRYVEYLTTHYLYDDPNLCVTCSSGAISQGGRAFVHGFELYFEKATLLYEAATLGGEGVATMPLTLLTKDGKVRRPSVGSGDPVDAFVKEIQHAVDVIERGSEPKALSGEGARDALLICHKEAESIKRGRVVRLE